VSTTVLTPEAHAASRPVWGSRSPTPPTSVTMVVRYRPLGDVLVAEISTPTASDGGTPVEAVDVVEVVDADLTITWFESSDGRRRLAAVEVLHASVVTSLEVHPSIDAQLSGAVADLVARGARAARAAGSLAARARVVCRSEIELDALPVSAANRPRAAPRTQLTPGRTRLCRAVRELADAVRSASVVTVDPAAAASLGSALDELAHALGRHGGVSPNRSAAVARARVAGAVGLSTAERVALRSLLDSLGDTSNWTDIAPRWRDLAAAIAPWSTGLRVPTPR
jgi:hypothetical protein